MGKFRDCIDECFFSGVSGHPDEVAVPYDTVVRMFPDAVGWEIRKEERTGSGFVLGDGVWLFPNSGHFTNILTVG